MVLSPPTWWIFNLTPWDALKLLEDNPPASLRRLPPQPSDGWGAFVVYVGLDDKIIPPDFPLHHQIIVRRPLGEGNSVFASLSPAWDANRAPAGQRALTLSTHTTLDDWWRLYQQDRPGYEARKSELADRVLTAAETAIPGLRAAAQLVLPGTPVTFQRFTRRRWGWVGGFPQTGLLRDTRPTPGAQPVAGGRLYLPRSVNCGSSPGRAARGRNDITPDWVGTVNQRTATSS